MAATRDAIARAVEKLAPNTARFVQGRNERLACYALEVLAKVVGVTGDQDALLQAVTAEGNSARIQAAEAQVVAGLASALENSAQQETVRQATAQIDIEAYRKLRDQSSAVKKNLSIIIVVGFFVTIALSYFDLELETKTREQLSLLIGALIAAFTAVVQYFFGSSSGSAEKTLMMQTKEPGTAPLRPVTDDGAASGGDATTDGAVCVGDSIQVTGAAGRNG